MRPTKRIARITTVLFFALCIFFGYVASTYPKGSETLVVHVVLSAFALILCLSSLIISRGLVTHKDRKIDQFQHRIARASGKDTMIPHDET